MASDCCLSFTLGGGVYLVSRPPEAFSFQFFYHVLVVGGHLLDHELWIIVEWCSWLVFGSVVDLPLLIFVDSLYPLV